MIASAQKAEAGAVDRDHGRELEWQLAATDLNIVRQWLTKHGIVDGFTIESRPAQSIYDTYLDTEDWRVHRAGFALRLRDIPGAAEATLKDLVPHGDGPLSRREINQSLGTAEEISLTQGHGPVSSRVQAVTGPRPLRALFRVRTHRQRFAVLRENQRVAEIALDETLLASADGRSKTRLQRVEVEAMGEGAPQILEGLVKRLRMECALEPARGSKFEVGMQSSGLSVPDARNLGATTIGATSSIAEVACANLRRHMMSWLACEPAARLGESPERLEDLRAAARGLQSTFRIFEAHLPKAWGKLRRRLKSMQRLLGAVHDLDFALGDLDAFAKEQGEASSLALQALHQRTVTDHLAARAKMLKTIDKASTQRLMGRLITQLPGAAFENSAAGDLTVSAFAAALIGRQYKKFVAASGRLHEASSAEEFRAVGRRADRLWETISAFADLYGDAGAEMDHALRKLHELLSSLEAIEFAAQRIQARSAGETTSSATAFLLGIHFEQVRAKGAKLRQRTPKLLAKVQGRRWKALRDLMVRAEKT